MEAVTSFAGIALSSILPGDFLFKSMAGQALTQSLNALFKSTGHKKLLARWAADYWTLGRYYQVHLTQTSPMYFKFEEYIIRKYLADFLSCELVAERGAIQYSLNGQLKSLTDHFQNHTISLDTSTSSKPHPNPNLASVISREIYITSKTAPVSILKAYVSSVCDVENGMQDVLQVFRATVIQQDGEGKKPPTMRWDLFNVKTNKTIANTFCSATVQHQLFDHVEWFMSDETERWYKEKGIPYKLGMVLHGPPGTGKTSVIKAIANRYGLPIFTIDLEVVPNADQLCNLITQSSYQTNNKPHILALEDIDRSKLFGHGESGISMSSFLNVIDGVIESFGRILIMTANDLNPLQGVAANALLRPGRIDRQILLDNFAEAEVVQMINYFYRPTQPILQEDICMGASSISPAELTKLFQAHPLLDQLPVVLKHLHASHTTHTTVDKRITKAKRGSGAGKKNVQGRLRRSKRGGATGTKLQKQ